jgi:hypothetical protein
MKDLFLTLDGAYSREETAEILGKSIKTLKRMEGKDLHPLRNPDDPRHRVFYARAEVDRLARQLGRRLRRRESSSAPPATARGASEQIPGPKVSRGFAMLGDGHTKAEVCVELELSLEQSELLEEKFVAWQGGRSVAKCQEREPRASSRTAGSARTRTNHGGRLILDLTPEMLAWQERIDEESRWAEDNNVPSPSPTESEDRSPSSSSETEDSEEEEKPPSSRAA